MDISALLTSAGINIGVCVLLFSLYSILRKQPGNVNVYFGRRLAQVHQNRSDPFCLDRLVPSPSWIMKAWELPEEEILAVSGLDAVVFIRILVFSIRIFSIAAVMVTFLVLPVNYYGQEMQHKGIPSKSLDVFSIGNVSARSHWLWAHCLSLYVISCSACTLLYFEYKNITNMRLSHISNASPNPSHFTVLVRAIPCSPNDSSSDLLKNFFTKYHGKNYLSHQMVYRSGTVQKLLNDAEKLYKTLKSVSIDQRCIQRFPPCFICGATTSTFNILSSKPEEGFQKSFGDLDLHTKEKECSAAFVFFKTRYSALVASQVLHSVNPMLWITDLAPEPHDVYWSNLCIPYKQIWFRKIGTLVATVGFMFLFIVPVTFVQGLTELDQIQSMFPFLEGLLKKKFMNQLVTGYLPSVILMLFMYTVPPTLMLLAVLRGSISRSGRKKMACCKILYFTIWVVFFVNVFSHSVISQLNFISRPKDIPTQLARAVPTQAGFFMTYVLTSGWASLACEVVQLYPLLCNLFNRYVLKNKNDQSYSTLSFPYHTEVPRVLLFGLLGFTCCILAPLIIPLLLIYYFLAYLVYRNQIMNVYVSKYESGGQFWPVAHNTTIFSLVLAQIIALGVFGLKRSSVASGFTIPLVISTLLFNEYCRQRFHPIFKNNAAEVLFEMDSEDKRCGRMNEIHQQLHAAYCQFTLTSHDFCNCGPSHPNQHRKSKTAHANKEDARTGKKPTKSDGTWTIQCFVGCEAAAKD